MTDAAMTDAAMTDAAATDRTTGLPTASERPSPRSDVLLISAQRTSTALLLAEAAGRRGLAVRVLDGPPETVVRPDEAPHWYGGPLLADRIAGRLGLGLLEPSGGWLAELPGEFTGRRVTLTTLAAARRELAARPAFVKPPVDKSFPPAVYEDGGRLPYDLPGDTPVLVSKPVTFATEYRLFVLDGRVVAGSRYLSYGRLDPGPVAPDALRFGAQLLAAAGGTLPSAVVVDVGLTEEAGWAVVEANMAWFAHCYAADPADVLDVVLRAAGPRGRVGERDRSFLRVGSG
ncbi:ATP-grasp domain-containing protein [Streptomyces sp. NPDC012769]|uniref:ATP-grasp domain-containing protein n=1 Tax=Streptomyces sp. NPDC012769 TaxID=3364848 RepID=UPI0036AB537B